MEGPVIPKGSVHLTLRSGQGSRDHCEHASMFDEGCNDDV